MLTVALFSFYQTEHQEIEKNQEVRQLMKRTKVDTAAAQKRLNRVFPRY